MDLIQGIKERRSIRKFQTRQVDRSVIEQIVDVARFAPSWKNGQIARYVVVEDPQTIQALASEPCVMGAHYNSKIISGAPIVVVETYRKNRSGYEKDGSFTTSKGDRWEMFDAGIAAQTFCLAAHEQGLGTVIMGVFDENEVAKVIDLPDDEAVGSLIAVGYPSIAPDAPPRKTAGELIRYI